MAVEAHHHLLHADGQKPAAIQEGGGGSYDAPWRRDCFYAGTDVAAERPGQVVRQGYRQNQQSSCLVPAAAPASASGQMMMTTTGRYGGQVCAADSGITYGGAQEVMEAPCRKRKRAAEQSQALGLAAAHLQQQQLVDVDRLVLQHTTNMWAELTEQRLRHARQVVAAVEAAAAVRLRAKDEEIERIRRLNWALEERVKSLFVEAQAWRDLAQSNEAAANALRVDLQHALDAQQARCGVAVAAAGGAADDAASCCCGENDDVGAGEEEVGTTERGGRKCVMCGQRAAEVLLLPCRHLCSCAQCAAAAAACPACGCAKNGTVRVNFS